MIDSQDLNEDVNKNEALIDLIQTLEEAEKNL